MSEMMQHCQMHCRETMAAMNTLAKQVDEARQSNDTQKMRAALEAVSKHHAEMRQHMQTCMRNTDASTDAHDHQYPSGTPPAKNERECPPASAPIIGATGGAGTPNGCFEYASFAFGLTSPAEKERP